MFLQMPSLAEKIVHFLGLFKEERVARAKKPQQLPPPLPTSSSSSSAFARPPPFNGGSRFCLPRLRLFLVHPMSTTGRPDRMSGRKWETKQQLIWWPAYLALLGCCLASLHFLSGRPVVDMTSDSDAPKMNATLEGKFGNLN